MLGSPPRDTTGFSTLYEVSRLLNSSLDLDVVLDRVMDVVIAVTGAERGFVLLTDPSGDLTVAVSRNVDRSEIERTGSEVSMSLCQRVATQDATMRVEYAVVDGR